MENENNSAAETKRRDRSKILKILAACAVCIVVVAAAFFTGFLARGCVRSDFEKSLDWMLGTIEDNYYFYDDFDEKGAKDLSLYAVAAKLDRYSEYYTKEQFQALLKDNSGEKSGIGVSYSFVGGKGILLNTVVGNSPACKAGLKAGDYLISGGNGEVSFGSAEAFSDYIDSFKTGEDFTVSTASGSFTLSKQFYTASYCRLATSETAWEVAPSSNSKALPLVEKRDGAISCLPEGTAYLSVSQFYGTAAQEFGLLIKKFNSYNCTSLIIDLRNNGGGYVSAMQDMAGYFEAVSKSGDRTAMTAEYKNGKRELYNCYDHGGESLVPEGTKVYVMANAGTASASEALIGVLVSYGILDYGNIFVSDYSDEFLEWAGAGAKTAQTYGKGIMQTTFVNYSTGEALKLTTARILWPNGKCIHDVALSKKDGCTPVPADWVVTREDTELQRVTEMIK